MNTTKMTAREQMVEMIRELDPKGFDYVIGYFEIENHLSTVDYLEERGMTDRLAEKRIEVAQVVKEFNERTIHPSNAKVGDGVSQCFYTDRHAFTVIKVTATTITCQRDKAVMTSKPEFVTGGFAGHCTNNDDQVYEYEADPQGEVVTFRWSKKYNRYQNKYSRVIKGRHEKYDYNF